jgi:hypothetical protein
VHRILLLLLIVLACDAYAQHTRLYAVVAGNDDPANFMAGSSLGSGLWQSDDTGRTWKQLGWKHIKAFSMDHDSNGRVLYLAAGNGVLKSTDYGESWKVTTDWRVAEVMDVKVIPEEPSIVIAATAHGVIKSTDAGNSWESAHKGIATPYTSRLHFQNDILYACNEDGIYTSTDLGNDWKIVTGSPKAVRGITALNDQVWAVGDSEEIMLTSLGRWIDNRPSRSALWSPHYSVTLQKRFAGGIDGVWEYRVSLHGYSVCSGPPNVHSITSIGSQMLAGTLGDGIWVRDGLDGDWEKLALSKAQVWTLIAVDIK